MAFWAQILLVVVLATLIIYIIGALASGGSMVKSIPAQAASVSADQLYYLPTASLIIRATAKVIITRNTANAIIEAKLAELALDTTVQTVPDTDAAFAIEYKASAFASDDLKFIIGASGLLEGINLTAEDRIANILTQFTDAPKLILSGQQAAATATLSSVVETTSEGLAVTTETKEYTNTFYILTKELRNKAASRSWSINVDGTSEIKTTVDASFSLTFTAPGSQGSPFANMPGTGIDGLLTRPLQTVMMNIFKDPGATIPDVQYQLVIPDESRIVAVPVKRSSFVKKTYGFKLTNGIFTENTINKPSEIEGFASIPVAVAKALVSIPAQLLQFKVENIKRQSALETEEQKLAKALFDARKENIGRDAELLKAKLEAEKSVLTAQKELITANKDIADAKKDWEKAKQELEVLLKKVHEAKQPA
jgi:hypothetical protein